MMTSAIAVSDPSSPARGNDRRISPQRGAQASLNAPEARIIAIPRYHACLAAAAGSRPLAFAPTNVGPITRKTVPKVLGVSSPSGIAVTSVRPCRRASRKAMAV